MPILICTSEYFCFAKKSWFAEIQFGPLIRFGPQPACWNGRKNLSFEFWKFLLWVWCPYYKASLSIFCLPKTVGLWNSIFGVDLNSDKRLPLWTFIPSIWKSLCMIGQHQNDHFDMVLQTMQKDHDARFSNKLPQMLKVGIRVIWSKMTICKIWLSLYFSF